MNRGGKDRTRGPDELRTAGPLILYVDDNADLRDLYATYFASHGCRVETASDGVVGVSRAITVQPDLVITDLAMPHVDGWQMTRRLKSDPRTAHIPIIACTGRLLGGSPERALDAGCDAYVVKPCFPEDLLREARQVLARRSAHRRSA